MARLAQTARAYKEPFSVQFSVFLANRVGQLKDLLDYFGRNDVRVVGVSVVDSTDWAVIRMVFSKPDRARELLKERNLPFTESEILLIVLEGEEALSAICGLLLGAEINVHFAYPLTIRSGGNAVMVFQVDDPVLSTHLLTRHAVTLLGNEDLADST